MDGPLRMAAACLAATSAVYALAGRRLAGLAVPCSRRAKRMALAAVLGVYATLLLSAITDRRNLASHLEEIMQNREKRSHEMMSDLTTMLSENPRNIKSIIYTVRNVDGVEDTELTISMKDYQVQPSRDDNHIPTNKTMEAPGENDVDEPALGPAGTLPLPSVPPVPQEEPLEKPWRVFSIPAGHVFVVDQVLGDEVTVHIRPSSTANLEQHAIGDDDAKQSSAAAGTCNQSQHQAVGTMSLYLYDCGPYGVLFHDKSSGEPISVPVPWPSPKMFDKLTAALVLKEGEELTFEVEPVMPESFTISPRVVAFYRPCKNGASYVITAASGTVERVMMSEQETAETVRDFTGARNVALSTSFRRSPDVFIKRNPHLIHWF